MSLRDRTLLLVAFLLIFTILVTTLALSWSMRQVLLEQAEANGKVIVQLLATSAGFSQHVPEEVEKIIGSQTDYLDELKQDLSLQRMMDNVAGGGDVIAIHVVDENLQPLAFSSSPGLAISREISALDAEFIQSALAEDKALAEVSLADVAPTQSLTQLALDRVRTIGLLGNSVMKVAIPFSNRHGERIGAVLIYLPTDRIQIALLRQLQVAVVVSAFALIYGIEAAIVWSRRVTRPLGTLKGAALDVEAGKFDPKSLEKIEKRRDELGQLARTFSRMAVEVQAREARLKEEVHVLRIEIDEARKQRAVAEITETDYFQKLQARAQEIRTRPRGEVAPPKKADE